MLNRLTFADLFQLLVILHVDRFFFASQSFRLGYLFRECSLQLEQQG